MLIVDKFFPEVEPLGNFTLSLPRLPAGEIILNLFKIRQNLFNRDLSFVASY